MKPAKVILPTLPAKIFVSPEKLIPVEPLPAKRQCGRKVGPDGPMEIIPCDQIRDKRSLKDQNVGIIQLDDDGEETALDHEDDVQEGSGDYVQGEFFNHFGPDDVRYLRKMTFNGLLIDAKRFTTNTLAPPVDFHSPGPDSVR